MTLDAAGVAAVAAALSGRAGLLAGESEIPDLPRQQVRFDRGTQEVIFGPVRRRVTATGIAVFQSGQRILAQPLEEARLLQIGQSLRVTLDLDATLGA